MAGHNRIHLLAKVSRRHCSHGLGSQLKEFVLLLNALKAVLAEDSGEKRRWD